MATEVNSGLLEFSDDQKIFVAIDEDNVLRKAVLIDREGVEHSLTNVTPTDEQVQDAVDVWLEDHPEATTTVEDGAVTLAKLNVDVLEKLRYSFITNKTLTPQNGYFVYDGCTINDIVAETELTGKHIFNNCTIGTLFVKGGEYEFHNCTFTFIRLYNSTGKFVKCVGNSIELTGACHNTVIDGCILTADTQAPIIINGSVADNVKIINNTIINNKSDVLTNINAECINTHGISNSIIDNNYLVINTEKNAIDISGHKGSSETAIRSFNNVVSNNIIESGDIEIYASKNLKVIGNKCRRINIEGDYQSEDYGEIVIEGNVITDRVSWHPTSGTPTAMNVRVIKNTISGRAFEAYYAIPSSVKVYVLGNTIKGIAVLTNDIAKDLIMNEHIQYVAPGESAYIPQCLVTANDGLTGITADTWFNGGIITNGEAENRYVKYRQINTHNGQALWWTQ